MHDSDSNLPDIRVLHQLGRSGGTLIAKCLAVMDGAILLSEVHPHGKSMLEQRGQEIRQYLPMSQAHRWFNLVSEEEATESERTLAPNDFAAEIALIDARGKASGKNLILRDFNTRDFVGINYRSEPPFRFLTVESLQDHFHPLRFFTVRHPADQWVSMSKLFSEDIAQVLERFLLGFRLFSAQAAEVGFVRYEDFALDPQTELRRICAALALPYDPAWQDRWAGYQKITGDNRARAGESRISPPRKNTLEPALRRRFEENADYRTALELLGYPA
jgi:hypothetical protein